jgi:APA family basic amino acid/polyamine antiporter
MPAEPVTVTPVEAPRTLLRAIGPLGATAIVVGNVIGSGIFLIPHNVAQKVGSAEALLAVWIVGGVLSLAGALSLGELGAAIPEAGGVYVYLREAYGKLAGFLYAWTEVLVITAGSIAALGVAFSIYAASLVPLSPAAQKVVAVGAIALLTAVNVIGVREGTAVQTVFTLAKLSGLAIIVGFALFAPAAEPVASAQPLPTPATTFSSFAVALIGVIWAFNGWHHFSLAAGEVKDPARVVPRAYLLGLLIITGAYLAANLAYLRVLSLEALAERQTVAAAAMEAMTGPRGATFVSVLILCSIFGALNGTVLAGPRACYAMARDGVLFSFFARIHPRFKTPAPAIVLVGAWSAVLALSGTYEELFTYVMFAGWIFLAAATLAVLVLRRRRPELPRPYRTWGYPWTPLIFVAGALVVTVNTLVTNPVEAGIGLAIVACGVPVFLFWRRPRRV